MKAENEERRVVFANQLMCNIDDGITDLGSIWFSDEAHFHLDGYVNKQNWRFWANENPHLAVQKSLHPKRVTVWCAVSKRSVIGPIFIHETVNSEVYLNILRDSFIPELQKFDDWNNVWFQQDGATPHRSEVIFQTLRDSFQDRVIALNCQKFNCNGIEWPPYSPDLNPCDYFLWGYLKDNVYRGNPKTLEELQEAITHEVTSISPDTLGKVADNFIMRLRHVIAVEGKPFEHIVS